MRHRSRTLALLTAAPLALGTAVSGTAAPSPAVDGTPVSVHVEGLRSTRGQVLACLTTQPAAFPDCRDDATARKLVVPADRAADLDFGPVAPGRYAVALLHDENGNGRADMALVIPREGFGFSRNPAIRFGPPVFTRAAFTVGAVPVRETIRMRYIL